MCIRDRRKAAIAEFDGICSGDITVIEAIEGKMVPELLPLDEKQFSLCLISFIQIELTMSYLPCLLYTSRCV